MFVIKEWSFKKLVFVTTCFCCWTRNATKEGRYIYGGQFSVTLFWNLVFLVQLKNGVIVGEQFCINGIQTKHSKFFTLFACLGLWYGSFNAFEKIIYAQNTLQSAKKIQIKITSSFTYAHGKAIIIHSLLFNSYSSNNW